MRPDDDVWGLVGDAYEIGEHCQLPSIMFLLYVKIGKAGDAKPYRPPYYLSRVDQ